MTEKQQENIQINLNELNQKIKHIKPEEILLWAYETFGKQFAVTTSFGIQSSVLLNMVSQSRLQKKIKIYWIDTGYLPKETYHYAEKLINDLSLEVEVLQSDGSTLQRMIMPPSTNNQTLKLTATQSDGSSTTKELDMGE